ncbi:LysM peptidoglycan-binding domain-containing protein [Paenibacillus sp. BSR1-1]|uniref:LysM peptidoglycan-binding domain-containing protein n=1 Tax=Paenibacillus sp. BSR1-1 TaxID=3020845 RepID=UPI0025B22D0B|nr:LysM peptidoglycan-binding domain-containing protein [Paenibacillus sp. BSR1-1]MDN3016671.1 LysM peptidoglycan-binding domain-containing protein [Paenibacillus sp. BSR1-1]
MNKEEPYRDQAERLKQRIQKINEKIDESGDLPPREQLHRQKKKKTKWKFKYPVIRLLVLFFILLPIIIFSVISYIDGKRIGSTVKTSGDSVGYETINLEKTEIDEKNKQADEQQMESNQVKNEAALTEENSTKEISTPPRPVNIDANKSGDKNSQPIQETKKSQPTAPKKTSKIVYHTVQPKETLYHIAMKYYKSQSGMNIIRQANHFQGDNINAGQVLKIPLNN